MESTVPPSHAVTATATTEDRTVAILGYITILGFIAAIVVHQGRRTGLGAFHLRQMLGLALTATVGSVLLMVPILGWLLWIPIGMSLFVLWIMGLISAIQGDERPVPLLGAHYQRWLAGVFA